MSNYFICETWYTLLQITSPATERFAGTDSKHLKNTLDRHDHSEALCVSACTHVCINVSHYVGTLGMQSQF